VIYCVVPEALAEELFGKLTEYYADDPNVTVIIDRREGNDRRSGQDAGEHKDQRVMRDRRHRRMPGTFPSTYSGD